jgi:hypothetical protein
MTISTQPPVLMPTNGGASLQPCPPSRVQGREGRGVLHGFAAKAPPRLHFHEVFHRYRDASVTSAAAKMLAPYM